MRMHFSGEVRKTSSRDDTKRRRSSTTILIAVTGGTLIFLISLVAWTASKASYINNELSAAVRLVSPLKQHIAESKSAAAAATLAQLRKHTSAAKEAADEPLWTLVSTAPLFGQNFAAAAEVARSADDVATLGLTPLLSTYESLNWNKLIPGQSTTDVEPLKLASPGIVSAAQAVRLSTDRLNQIDTKQLLPGVGRPLTDAREQLAEVTGTLSAAADASQILPVMLGSESPQSYLLMIQNNAEIRASGGIPAALAVLKMDRGGLSIQAQSSAESLGALLPPVSVDPHQELIYTNRLGRFMQDVNLTPDFPTAAGSARTMWERKKGELVDGVISIDPVALSYILKATGPVILHQDSNEPAYPTMPTELTSENVVKTLLSDVYAKIESPLEQDAYFANLTAQIFTALTEIQSDPGILLREILRSTDEGRILVWSSVPEVQAKIHKYAISGSVSGPSVGPTEFGIYFNDGTGAKMDFYMKRSVQLLTQCSADGYSRVTVRITSTNSAPVNASMSLPAYVTGSGIYGVPPGSVQTNLVAYGPAQATIETTTRDGQDVGFAPYVHAERPVGVLSIRLSPGESSVVDFSFGKIVQSSEPTVRITPTLPSAEHNVLPLTTLKCE